MESDMNRVADKQIKDILPISKVVHQLFSAAFLPCLKPASLVSDRLLRAVAPKKTDRKCVYCSRQVMAFDDPLLPEEAKMLPLMCPRHFHISRRPKKYLREPQDPKDICQVCTVSFRIFSQFCYLTTELPVEMDVNADFKKCLLSLEGAEKASETHQKRDF